MDQPEKPSNIRSISEQRERHNKLARKVHMTPEQRIFELEEDMLRVMEMALYLEQTAIYQEKLINKLLIRLKEERVASFSSEESQE